MQRRNQDSTPHFRIRINPTPLYAAACVFIAQPLLSWADSSNNSPPHAAPGYTGLQLDDIVVTATAADSAKMQLSLSVSTLDAAQLHQTSATNTADILRTIPGIHAESSSGEGNANLTVRGLPISAGGARYVQLQEDGLPVLQFGDIAFGTADQFLRIDTGLERLEVVRGGSASTMATNSPGGVVNFISRTGATTAGAFAVSKGVDFSQTRYDFNYGQPINDGRTRFFLAGFYRSGEGIREPGTTIEQGGQLRGNATQDFDHGYLQLNFKLLDDQVPMAMPVPVTTANSHISTIPHIDPRTASFYSPYWVKDQSIDDNNSSKWSDVNDGLKVSSQSIGIQVHVDLENEVVIENKFRISSNSGRFIAIFPADNGYTTGPFTIATGPSAGQPYSGGVFTATVFNVSIDDLGNTLNDLSFKKRFSLNESDTIDIALGLYSSIQQVALTWNFNQYLLTTDGSKPALVNNASTNTTTPGLIAAGTDVWGGCCTRNIDAEYTTESPYASLIWQHDEWSLDASLRRDNQHASGAYNLAESQQFLAANTQFIDYTVRETSYSLGANYLLSPDIALFARHSKGYAFNADRIMFNGFALDGSVPIPVNRVRQTEGGIKWRYRELNLFATYFDANTAETNYEATSQVFTNRIYTAHGIELEAAYAIDNFRISGGATYTDAKIHRAEDISLEGNSPRRQAAWIYQLLPAYTLGPATFGAAFIGTTDSWGDDAHTIKLPGYITVNAFIDYAFDQHLIASLSINNLTNKLAFTEVEGDGHAARALDGRSATMALKYRF